VRRAAALIVGGGPAGCAAAIALARAGRSPLLVERSEGPRDVVCGGFLGWDALAALGRLGIDAASLDARPIRTLRLVAGRRALEAPLPRAAAGLSRRTLDGALIRAAAGAGAEVLRGRTARAAGDGAVRMEDGEELRGEMLVLATGKHELRGLERGADLASAPVGLRASVAAAADLEGVVELHLFDGGYAGLLLQEDGRANLCLSVARATLRAAGGIEALVAQLAHELPALGSRIEDPGPWSAVAGVPYGWRSGHADGPVVRVGDQAAVIASIAGDGVALALRSGAMAAEPGFQRRFARQARVPVVAAEMVRGAAERPVPRRALMGAIGAFPALAGLLARLTRIG
jgi:flavin-dependent dehydrogenase